MTQPDNPQMGDQQYDYYAEPRRSAGTRLVLLLVAMVCIGTALVLVFMKGRESASRGLPPAGGPPTGSALQSGSGDSSGSPGKVTLGVAYGTEKRTWIEQAAKDFAATPDGKNVEVNLILPSRQK